MALCLAVTPLFDIGKHSKKEDISQIWNFESIYTNYTEDNSRLLHSYCSIAQVLSRDTALFQEQNVILQKNKSI